MERVDTWLDVVLDRPEKLLSLEKSDAPFICGHDYVIIDYKLKSRVVINRTVRRRNFRRFSPSEFYDMLQLRLNSSIEFTDHPWDVNDMLSAIRLETLELLDKFAPYKERTLRRNPVPWFSKDLRVKFKQRDRLYAKRSNSSVLRARYKQLRKRLKSELRGAREKFFTEKLGNSPDPSSIWSLLNKFGVIGLYRNSPLATFSPDELNSHYAKVASAHPLCTYPEIIDILSPLNDDLPIFDLSFLDTVIVYQTALSTLPKAKDSSADDLPIFYFKDVLRLIAKYVTEIFNVSIRTGVYPKLWKISLIVPLNKMSSSTSPSDTRPIANLSHLAMVFNKLVAEQLLDFLETNDLLTPYQSGFRRCYSTQDALIKISEDIRCGIDKGLYTILIMFDFKKAFNTLKYSTLLRIMRKLNFSDVIRWFHSYLSERYQSIIDLQGSVSEPVNLTSGVPQGSISGPVAFLMLINSIVAYLKYCSETCILFADDFQIYLQCKRSDISTCIGKLNEDINSIANWAGANDLQLNMSKTTTIIFASTQNLMRLDVSSLPPILLNGTQIPLVKTLKKLGGNILRRSHLEFSCLEHFQTST